MEKVERRFSDGVFRFLVFAVMRGWNIENSLDGIVYLYQFSFVCKLMKFSILSRKLVARFLVVRYFDLLDSFPSLNKQIVNDFPATL